MALKEIESLIDLVASVGDPGEDPESDEAFRRVEFLISDDETDWAEVEKVSLDLLGKTFDLRVAVALVGSSLRDPQQGLASFGAALTLLRRMLEVHGEHAHPQIQSDSPLSGLRKRAMSIDELGSPFGTVGDEYEIIARMRRLPLTSAGEIFTFRDLMIVRGELANVTLEESERADRQLAFETSMGQSIVRGRSYLDSLLSDAEKSLSEVEELERVFNKTCADVDGAPHLDLDALKYQLRQVMLPIEEALEAFGGTSAASREVAVSTSVSMSGSAGVVDAGVTEAAMHSSGAGFDGVSSRADVLVAIQAIQKYYRENEPSSPVPLLLQRASRFVNMNFVDIVQDIAGESVDNLQVLFGTNDDGLSGEGGSSDD